MAESSKASSNTMSQNDNAKTVSRTSKPAKPETASSVIFGALSPYWKWALLAVVMMAVEVVGDLSLPTLMSTIVDKGVSVGNLSTVLQTGLFMLLISVVGMAGGIACTYYASKASLSAASDLRSRLFRKVQTYSFDSLDEFSTGSLVTRLTNDVVQVQNLTLSMMRIMVGAPILLIGGIIMAIAINPGLSLILVFVLPILVVTLTFVIMKGFPLFRKVQAALDRVNGIMRENLAGVRLIKAFVRSDYEEKRFGKANNDLAEITVTGTRMVGLVLPIMFLIMNMAVVVAVWFSGQQVNLGTMEVGKVIAFTTYLSLILFSLLMVSFVLMNASRAVASARRIAEVLNKEGESELEAVHLNRPRITDNTANNTANTSTNTAALETTQVQTILRPGDLDTPIQISSSAMPTPVLEYDHVTFHYPRIADSQPVLYDVSFKVNKGDLVGILGSTGSGKSTLINLIPRFYDVDSGAIYLEGKDIRTMGLAELRSKIGLVPQDSVLFTGTIAENLRWGNPNATDEEIEKAAWVACALDFVKSFPKGFDTIIGQRGVGLSGGQRQRLCIARAILRKPTILILDDSTSAVDMATEATIQTRLREEKGMTMLVIAQRVSSVLDADQILVLDHGRIAGEGTHEQLMKSNEIYQDIYRSQVTEGVTNA